MTEISGNNIFGTLLGTKLSFEDVDTDSDGVISKEEFKTLLDRAEADSVELSTGNTNTDKTADEDSVAMFEQETQMEAALDELKKQISIDFCGANSKYIADIAFDLKDYLEEFKSTYTGDISGMAAAFNEALPDKYAELKALYLDNDSGEVKSKVLDEIIELQAANTDAKSIQTLGQILETAADNFIASYSGENLEADLKTYLEEYMKSDYEKLEGNINEYKTFEDSLGTYVDSREFEALKEQARRFLESALEQVSNLQTITDQESLERFFDGIDNASELKEKMESIIASISKETLLEKVESGKITTDSAENAGENGKTENAVYSVNAEEINVTFNNDVMKKSSVRSMLQKDSVKNQFKIQIVEALAERGMSFTDVEAVFNNAYAEAITEYINNPPESSLVKVTLRMGYKSVTRFKSDAIIKDFTEVFNSKFQEKQDNINKSDTDFDVDNIDISGDKNILPRNMLKKAAKELRGQVYYEAHRMCKANGVAFDLHECSEIFESALHSDYDTLYEFLINFKTEYSIWVTNRKAK